MKSLFSIVAFCSIVGATPLYFTFSGVASNPNYANIDNAGFLAANHIQNFTVVNYVFLVDHDALGRQEYYDGSSWERDNVGTRDLFYTEFIGGGLIEGVTLTPPAGQEHSWITGYNAGGYDPSQYAYINGGSTSNMYFVNDQLARWGDVTDWQVGMSNFTGFERAYNANGAASVIWSSLTLVNISETNPMNPQAVPEPPMLSLFFAGLCMIPLMHPRKKK